MSENKSITASDTQKAEASKSGWLLKWTNYLKGNRAARVPWQLTDKTPFRLPEAVVRALERSPLVLQVSRAFLLPLPPVPPSPLSGIPLRRLESFPDGAYIYLVRLMMMCLCNYLLYLQSFLSNFYFSESFLYVHEHTHFLYRYFFFSFLLFFLWFHLRSIAFSCPWLGVFGVSVKATSLHVLHHNSHICWWTRSWFIIANTQTGGVEADTIRTPPLIASPLYPIHSDAFVRRAEVSLLRRSIVVNRKWFDW